MNDQQDLERIVADSVRSIGPLAPSDGAHELTSSRVRQSRQDPEWLALIKEPPMRTHSRPAVGSPTMRVAAIMVATLLLAVAVAAAGIGVQRLVAADSTIIVAADGSGHYSTISEAVQAAESSQGIDEIWVRSGTYIEAIVIKQDITLKGVGDRGGIVIMAPENGPEWDTQFPFLREQPFALVLKASEGSVENLTLRGTDSRLVVDGGAPMVRDLRFDGVGEFAVPGTAKAQALIVTGGSLATILGNDLRDGGGVNVFSSAAPAITGNLFLDGPVIYGDFGSGATVIDNVFGGPGPFAIRLGEPSDIVVADNEIAGRDTGIDSVNGLGTATIEGNKIDGTTRAAIGAADHTGSVVDNVITDSVIGISWSGEEGLIADNRISGGTTGIIVSSGAPIVQDNTVEGSENRGLMVSGGSSPKLTGNTICGNGTNLFVVDGATPEIDSTNEICEDAAAG